MKLTRTWLGETYECPIPQGSSDDWKDFGEYRVSWNTSLDYWSVSRFNKDVWREWFQELKSEALSLKKGNVMEAQECLHRLIERGAADMRDELWDHFFVQSSEDFAEELLALVPKCNQHHYKCDEGYIDTANIVKDYPKRVLHMITESGVI
jgi:hypothetical protein